MDAFESPHPGSASDRHLYAVDSVAPYEPFDPFAGDRWPEPPRRSGALDDLIAHVGGADALMRLDAEPLPDEPFDWSVVEAQDRPFVVQILELSDPCCDEMLDTELRTATRRILARVAARDPRALRRSTNARRCAAGLVWLAGRANGEFGRRGRWTSQSLWHWFGVADCSDRGRSLRAAAGLVPEEREPFMWSYEPFSLGDAALLHSRVRVGLIAHRDALEKFENDRRPWSLLGDGRTAAVRAAPVKAVVAAKGVVAEGARALVLVGLGDNLDDARFFALSIPDAYDLVRMVQRALEGPMPVAGAS